MVESPVTTHVDLESMLTFRCSAFVEDEALSTTSAAPSHVLPSSRKKSTELMVSTSMSPFKFWLMPVNVAVAPLLPAAPQLFESLPAATISFAASESKSSFVFDSAIFADVFVR